MNYTYPAVFEPDGDGYFVNFPDLEGCYTEGNNIEHAKKMAKEVLELILDVYILDEKKPLPKPSKLEGDNIYYIKGETGQSTSYSESHKKSYEKNKDKILTEKRKKEIELQEQGYKNFREFLHKDTLKKLDIIIKKSGTNRREFITNLIDREFSNMI